VVRSRRGCPLRECQKHSVSSIKPAFVEKASHQAERNGKRSREKNRNSKGENFGNGKLKNSALRSEGGVLLLQTGRNKDPKKGLKRIKEGADLYDWGGETVRDFLEPSQSRRARKSSQPPRGNHAAKRSEGRRKGHI